MFNVNINLEINGVLDEKSLLSKYSSILHAILHLQSHVLGCHVYSFSQEPESSSSLHSHQH